MMNSFLAKAAVRVFEQHELQALQNLKIVLPSRRAVLYFRNEMARLSSIPFFAPEISSVDDFIQGLSGLQPIDPIDLYFECFELWRTLDPGQSLEKFLTWAPTVIRDFDLIDAALLPDPHRLFHYLSAAEALKRWDLTDHELSAVSQEYFTFFDKMERVYDRLQQILPEKGVSYTGMAYRKAADNIPESGYYYFIGLNALSLAEEKIIKALVKAGRAECLWDSDSFYMTGDNKAGKKLRDYRETHLFGKEWYFTENLLGEGSRDLYVYKLSGKTLQAKVAVDIASQSSAQSHAVVVIDEGDFTPLLVQLPALDMKVNISGGAALKSTLLMTSLDTLFCFLESETLRTEWVRALLGDELLRAAIGREAGERQIAQWEKQYLRSTRLFIKRQGMNLSGSELFGLIMNIRNPLSYLLAAERFLDAVNESDSEEAPFAEVLLQKFKVLKARTTEELSAASFRILFQEVSKNVSLPFEKQPDARLQVMSMLETRCLDFEEITFLSFTEGNLPSAKKNNSFIPYDALRYFNLPSYGDQDAIMAYHFFRLLQRARKVNFLYTEDTGAGIGRKEKSRFLYQIEEELVPISPNTRLFFPELSFLEVNKVESFGIFVRKTPEVLHKIRHFLENKGLSATSLNEYFTGVMGFYWRHIEGIQNREKEEASIGQNIFGSLVHYILEKTDEPYLKLLITREILSEQKEFALREFDRLLSESQPDFDFDYGLNAVMKTLAKELVGRYFDKRIRDFTAPFTIEALEKKFETTLEAGDVRVKIKGTVDKIERHGDRLVVIDYKTGDVDAAKIRYSPGKSEVPFAEYLRLPDRDKFRQLLLYKFLISDIYGINTKYEIKFYSFRKLETDLILEVEDQSKEEVMAAVQQMIIKVAKDLLDADLPLRPDPEQEVPGYSDFAELLRYANP